MSDDIVARLRAFYTSQTVREAADEIERLRAELRKYTGDGHNTKGEPCTPEGA